MQIVLKGEEKWRAMHKHIWLLNVIRDLENFSSAFFMCCILATTNRPETIRWKLMFLLADLHMPGQGQACPPS